MRPEKENDNFFSLSKKLYSLIKKLIDENQNYPYQHTWENPSTWNTVLTNLRAFRNQNEYIFAKNLSSLSKHLDFYSTAWIPEDDQKKLFRLVSQISRKSYEIVYENKNHDPAIGSAGGGVCGLHEDGACVFSQLNIFSGLNKEPLQEKSYEIKFDHYKNFQEKPLLTCLPKGSKLIRISNSENNTPVGCWWMYDKKPASKKEWRSNFAVLTAWNLNNFYVEIEITTPIHAWQGIAASQPIPNKECILKGGHAQLYINQEELWHSNDFKNLTGKPVDFYEKNYK